MTTMNFNYGNPAIGDLGFVYAKLKWMHSFKAFNLKGHFSVIPSMIENTKNNREKLQKMAELNKSGGVQFQIRIGDNIVFQTK